MLDEMESVLDGMKVCWMGRRCAGWDEGVLDEMKVCWMG